MKLIRLIIAGGRDFDDWALFEREVSDFLFDMEAHGSSGLEHSAKLVIISGGNRAWNKEKRKWTGADYFAELYAHKNHIPIDIYPADWETHGKAAGPIRNTDEIKSGTHLLAFWDKKSKGTKDILTKARKAYPEENVREVNY